MAYDNNDPTQTSHHAALYPHLNNSINFYLEKGCPRSKIIAGLPTYGRSYTLADLMETGIGAPVTGPGNPGAYTQSAGFLGYNEICEMVKREGLKEVWDKESGSVYTWIGDQWVSYDNIDSVEQKVKEFLIQK